MLKVAGLALLYVVLFVVGLMAFLLVETAVVARWERAAWSRFAGRASGFAAWFAIVAAPIALVDRGASRDPSGPWWDVLAVAVVFGLLGGFLRNVRRAGSVLYAVPDEYDPSPLDLTRVPRVRRRPRSAQRRPPKRRRQRR